MATFYEIQFSDGAEMVKIIAEQRTEADDMMSLVLEHHILPAETEFYPILRLVQVTQHEDGIHGDVQVLQEVDLGAQQWWQRAMRAIRGRRLE